MIATVCTHCKRITPKATNGRCPTCHNGWQNSDNARRNTHPRAAIYRNPRWRQAARACLTRDHWACQDCGLHITELRVLGLRLTADHIIPILECDDPYDVDNLEARCSACHGRKDAPRATTRFFQEGRP